MLYRRDKLFAISSIRGGYPQFFFAYPDGTTTFLGGWEKIGAINDYSDIPKDVLDHNPGIETWDKVFGDVVQSFL
jgi:hypothetical protein